ncbi:DNA-methyltransferase [Acidipropionibacterium jensenii]|uniref:DNA-methyltransferase n=1 Tax=Acidipropionibacterium jensenii TaxID=1749 RepID=UPI00214C42B9|nr:DNA methyltransferase [Acidipropionibacterium jensenii]
MTSIVDPVRDGRARPGQVRDAIVAVLAQSPENSMTLTEIEHGVRTIIGHSVASSSIRSSLNLHQRDLITRIDRGEYALTARMHSIDQPEFEYKDVRLFENDCLAWLASQPEHSVHAVVTDPPYGASEYSAKEQTKLRNGIGGVWRIPPTLDGVTRSPVPRFTTLTDGDLHHVQDFFTRWSQALLPVLVPGANVLVATNPLVSHVVSMALSQGGLERRGEIIRLVQTLRGGDRPKGAHKEFPGVSVMPRSQWEPWLVYRKPLSGSVAQNLRLWGTGGFRRISAEQPFGDVIKGPPARTRERAIAPHPSLKPQAFLRQVVRASLPLGTGVVLDPFAGSGSTLAAAQAVGYRSIGVERDPDYVRLASEAIPALSKLKIALSEG